MSNAREQRVMRALAATGFVEPASSEADKYSIRLMCRVRGGRMEEWASLVEDILIASEDDRNQGIYWQAHISRLYMLKDRKLVYGWLFALTAQENIGPVLNNILSVINRYKKESPAGAQVFRPPPRPEADAKGNPIVPNEFLQEDKPLAMAGMDPDTDRNAYANGKGAFTMGRNRFRPPTL